MEDPKDLLKDLLKEAQRNVARSNKYKRWWRWVCNQCQLCGEPIIIQFPHGFEMRRCSRYPHHQVHDNPMNLIPVLVVIIIALTFFLILVSVQYSHLVNVRRYSEPVMAPRESSFFPYSH